MSKNVKESHTCTDACCSCRLGSEKKMLITKWSSFKELKSDTKRFENGQSQNNDVCLNSHSKRSRPDNTYIDLYWLLERCCFDVQFTCSVLIIFKEQGRRHIASLLDAIASDDSEAISFHAVSMITMLCLLFKP